MIKHTVELYLLKKSFTPSVNITQADTGHQIECTFPDIILPSGTTVKVWAIKPSGKIVYNDCIVSENTVLVNVTNQMAAEKGVTLVQLKLTNNGELVSSFPVHLKCSMDVSGNGIESENEITALDKFLEEQAKKLDAVIAEKTADIIQNKTDIAELKKDVEILKEDTSTLKKDLTHKADAIVETASGETIQAEDSSGLGFEGLRIFGKSTQDGVPTPESPVPIANVGDKGTVEVGVSGKNLIDFDKYYENFKEGDEFVGTANDLYRIKIQLPKKFIGKKLTFSSFVYHINEHANIRCGARINGKPINGTTTKDVNKWFFSKLSFTMIDETDIIYFDYGSDQNVRIKNAMLEIGNTPTTYEPYRTPQTITLSTPNGLPGVKVDSGGNYTDSNGQQWICDERDYGRGKYVQRVHKLILDGSQDMDVYSPGEKYYVILSNALHRKGVHVISNKLQGHVSGSGSDTRGDNTTWLQSVPEHKRLYVQTNIADINALKENLAANNVTVYYPIASPIERDLTPEELAAYKALHTNYPTTVISNDESAHMEVSYVADTKNYIVSKIETPLQKQITDLQNALISQKISGGV